MHYDWILDVLSDMRNFALANDLPALASQLQETAVIAAAEIADRRQCQAPLPTGEASGQTAG